jgi:hypothetical protein
MSHINFSKFSYSKLNDRQKEAHNFQKVSALLADYGFQTINLSDDWNGADFIALHASKKHVLHIQLKGRLTISKKYQDKGLWIAFPEYAGPSWYVIPHDELVGFMLSNSKIGLTKSWSEDGAYSCSKIPRYASNFVAPYLL